MKTRWAVRHETGSLFGPAFNCIVPPRVSYTYHRWRWQARLAAFMNGGTSFPYLGVTTSQILGRIKVKSSEERIKETTSTAHALQQQMYEQSRQPYCRTIFVPVNDWGCYGSAYGCQCRICRRQPNEAVQP